jgi:hypothetical protein
MTAPDRTYTITIPAELADVTRTAWTAALADVTRTAWTAALAELRQRHSEMCVNNGAGFADRSGLPARIARIEIALGLLDKETR